MTSTISLSMFNAINLAEQAPFSVSDTDNARLALTAMSRVSKNEDVIGTAVFLAELDDSMISERDVTGMVNDCAVIFLNEVT